MTTTDPDVRPDDEHCRGHSCVEPGCPCWTVHVRVARGAHAGHRVTAVTMPGDGTTTRCDCGQPPTWSPTDWFPPASGRCCPPLGPAGVARLTRLLLALDREPPTPAQRRRLTRFGIAPLTRLEAAAALAEVLGGER